MRILRRIRPLETLMLFLGALGMVLAGPGLNGIRAGELPRVLFILDASGSMWGKAGDQTKMEAARDVLTRVVPEIPDDVAVGLMAYGHRRLKDCTDIEILVPMAEGSREQILDRVKTIAPRGKTPMADALVMATREMAVGSGETTVVLVSDGEETCRANPCETVRELRASGVRFVLHVVGFGVNEEQKAQLACFAEAGGGEYFGADTADTLLGALETVKTEVVRKAEVAKTTVKKAVSALGKLHITIPKAGLISLNALRILKAEGGVQVKEIKDPPADSLHPLLAGTYRIVAGFANSNYDPDSEVVFGTVDVKGGETTDLSLGCLHVSLADSLAKIPAGAVILTREEDPGFSLSLPYTGNDYYFYKPKPLPAGTYTLGVHYKKSYLYRSPETPVPLARDIRIEAGGEATAVVDAGIQIKKPQSSGASAWELVAPDGDRKPLLRVNTASNGDYPLWLPYAVSPGTFDLLLYMEGMDDPLPIAQGIVINPGELLSFDTGL